MHCQGGWPATLLPPGSAPGLKTQLTEELKLKTEHYGFHKCIERRLPYYQAAALLKSAEIRDEKNTQHHQRHLQTIRNTVANLTHTEN